jgi:hypothetical protein
LVDKAVSAKYVEKGVSLALSAMSRNVMIDKGVSAGL